METCILKIAEEYTKYPAGRFQTDGPYSGEQFREDYLIPKLKKHKKVVVYIDGVKGYGSSFLEEAFGGIVRKKYFTKEELTRQLEIKLKDKSFKSYETEIWDFINNAE